MEIEQVEFYYETDFEVSLKKGKIRKDSKFPTDKSLFENSISFSPENYKNKKFTLDQKIMLEANIERYAHFYNKHQKFCDKVDVFKRYVEELS